MKNNTLIRLGVFVMTGTIAVSMTGCGSKKNNQSTEEKSKETTTEAEKTTTSSEDHIASGVVVPEDFKNMIYPMEALMVEDHSKGYEYYADNTDHADSFWYTMAVLSSRLHDDGLDNQEDSDGSYNYYTSETMDTFAAALYADYGKGNLEFPDVPEEDAYAIYDTENEYYGLRIGNVGTMVPLVIDCQETEAGYEVTAELNDSETTETYGTYHFAINTSTYEGDESIFDYSIESFGPASDDGSEESSTEEAAESTTQAEESSDTEDTEETTDTGSDSGYGSSSSVSQSEALDLAKDYYGEDAQYSYKETTTVGDYDYYDFSVSGDGITSTDVLVSTDGQNVIGGVKNSDGSWSFDQ